MRVPVFGTCRPRAAWLPLMLSALGFLNPTALSASEPDIEFAVVDGIVDLDRGENEFVFGLRLSAALRGNALEADVSLVPRQGPEMLFWSVNGAVEVARLRGRSDYPVLSPFAIAGVGGTTLLGDGRGTKLTFNVGAGAKIYTKERFGVRAEFREHFYWEAGEPVLNLEVAGGVVFRLAW